MTSKPELSENLWRARKAQLADNFLNIKVCRNCKSPRCEGYICMFCNEDDGNL